MGKNTKSPYFHLLVHPGQQLDYNCIRTELELDQKLAKSLTKNGLQEWTKSELDLG